VFSLPFYEKLFKGIKDNKWYPYNTKDINDFLDTHHFSGEPLLPLVPKDEKRLRSYLFRTMKGVVSEYRFKDYCLNPLVKLERGTKKFGTLLKDWPYVANLNIGDDTKKKQLQNFIDWNGVVPMTPDEKIDFLKNPSLYGEHRYIKSGGGESDFCRQGYRSIEEYDGLSKGRFIKLLKKAQKSTGKKNIRILDIGGGIGQALQDIKRIDENVFTINMTIDPESSLFASDRTIIGSAERFPADLLNSVDLVITNMAFRYFPFADLAVRNIIHSLSLGGMADVFVSTERSPTSDREIKKRLTETYSWLLKLKKEGCIKISFTNGYFMKVKYSVDDSLYPCRGIKVTKLKQIPISF